MPVTAEDLEQEFQEEQTKKAALKARSESKFHESSSVLHQCRWVLGGGVTCVLIMLLSPVQPFRFQHSEDLPSFKESPQMEARRRKMEAHADNSDASGMIRAQKGSDIKSYAEPPQTSWLIDFKCHKDRAPSCTSVCTSAGLTCDAEALTKVTSAESMMEAVQALPGDIACLSFAAVDEDLGWDGPTIKSADLECGYSKSPNFRAGCGEQSACHWGRLCACGGVPQNPDDLTTAQEKVVSQARDIQNQLYPTFQPSPDAGYHVTLERANGAKPFIDAERHPEQSKWHFNYAPAFLTLPDGSDALVVRSVNGTEYEAKGGTASTADDPDYVTITRFVGKDGSSNVDHVHVEPITLKSISLAPKGKAEACGLQDPRIVQDKRDGTYYLTAAAYGHPRAKHPVENPRGTYCGNADSLLASTKTPENPASWKRHNYNCNGGCGKSAAILIREEGPHYMFWGIPAIHVSVSTDLINWKVKISEWAKPIPAFSEMWIEAGSPPEKLDDGNYIMTYNTVDDKMWWGISYLILDKNDPTKILQRGSHLLWPRFPYETGKTPDTEWQPYKNCIGAMNSLHRLPGDEQRFMGYYTAGDAVAGAAVISVVSKNEIKQAG